SYGTFARILGRYVRDRKTITLEDAVHRMAGIPAARLKLFDRGLLRPGMKADVVVFDPTTVADKADFANPHQYAVDFRHVVVNGRVVIADGEMTSERPGRVLYGPAKKYRRKMLRLPVLFFITTVFLFVAVSLVPFRKYSLREPGRDWGDITPDVLRMITL